MSFFKKLFGLDEVSPHNEQDALLVTVNTREELIALESLLRNAEIPYECRARGAGGPLNVIAGYSIYSTDVFVRADMLETAKELIRPIDDAPDDLPDTDDLPETDADGDGNDTDADAMSDGNDEEARK